jgi:hypothetical protein
MSTVITNSNRAVGIIQYEGSPVAIAVETFAIAPGPQSTVVPTWFASASDYEQFVTDGIIQQITEAATASLIADATNSNVQLFSSGTPTTAVVTNPGNIPAWIALDECNAVVAVVGSGTLVAPGANVSLALASNSYLAGITESGSALLQAVVGS